MTNLSILNQSIRVQANLYSLNDLHVASGKNRKHEPNRFMRLEQTQELISEINSSPDLGISSKVAKNGPFRGTWVCKELVYAYAMWISAKFHLQVIRAFDAQHTEPQNEIMPIMPPSRMRLLMNMENGRVVSTQVVPEDSVVFRTEDIPKLISEPGYFKVDELLSINQAINEQLKLCVKSGLI
ncbi:KilA-N domain-containing protein [Vibrio fluvialis]|uniref:KilA-N domain-containing protein n=1 Tax=Vibrio fluvialis TaxID=676 RepID=UPI001EEA709B|nr:KilA-N domain-containing protein [Vibrio fluvialis]EKO3965427.1 KilA-N domain-containing protein [Vibrio fluvialis]MCG6351325.1 KilA-N domain-containing protein [Vibrio fluvialis]